MNGLTKGRSAVIIGAGQTGRGFVARMVASSDYRISFVDTSAEVVRRINEDGAYTIHYYNRERPPVRITEVGACLAGTGDATKAVAEADLVFTAIGESNLPSLAELLAQARLRRQESGSDGPLAIITCENGTAPARVLREALQTGFPEEARGIVVSESAIFCTTVNLPGTRLDILSEDYPELPYDGEALPGELGIPCLVPAERFPTLLRRKIYTYNCISACITYLGAFKDYKIYAEAANDPDVSGLLERLAEPLNRAISRTLGFDLEDQRRFSQRAVAKFSDYGIVDYVDKNARDVARKLGPDDRLIAPARMIMDTGGDPSVLTLTIAAALHYARRERESAAGGAAAAAFDPSAVLTGWSGLPADHPLVLRAIRHYADLERIGRGRDADWTPLTKGDDNGNLSGYGQPGGN
ncbi:mannitol dehydrogenase [Cohnella hongkongensis]|uniref:Mannitol dehydrogenase n=1 Tax=Cohnella hongkongensis TaxID=178337 RepID=A0ABV9F6H1_9BACL